MRSATVDTRPEHCSLGSTKVDRGRDCDSETEPGVAVVAGEQQKQRGNERDERGYAPGDTVDGHLVIVADTAVRVRC